MYSDCLINQLNTLAHARTSFNQLARAMSLPGVRFTDQGLSGNAKKT
jgi:hypothetical protein